MRLTTLCINGQCRCAPTRVIYA